MDKIPLKTKLIRFTKLIGFEWQFSQNVGLSGQFIFLSRLGLDEPGYEGYYCNIVLISYLFILTLNFTKFTVSLSILPMQHFSSFK